MTGGPLLLARRFRRLSGWRNLAWISGAVGMFGLAGFASIQLFLLERELAGIAQRMVLLLVVAWMTAAALRLISGASPRET